jgi:protein SCO1/2
MTRLLCVLALLAAVGCKNAAADIPQYGSTGIFALRDQTGASFGSAELRGQVWIAAFMFTRCPTICPVITARMKTLQDRAQAEKLDVRLVSISVDPENDTPEVLSAYAKKHGAEPARWSFLTGDAATIKQTSEQGFKSALEGKADANVADFGITHGSHLILVDRELRIRGFYRSSDDAEMARLIVDAARLAK